VKSIQGQPVVLASSALWRSEALTRLGIPHLAQSPHYQEPPFVGGALETHVQTLALGKAKSLAAQHPGAILIGLDQLIEVKGQVLGKPGEHQQALAQLRLLNGQTHRLVNGLALVWGKKEQTFFDQSELKMRSLQEAELEYYLQAETPYQCAGSYQIEGLGASLFEQINTPDLGSIVGLPVHLLLNGLRRWGFSNLLAND